MLVPPPGRFSISTCWPQPLESRSPTILAITSVGPPAANGTIRRTGCVGQASALARSETIAGINPDAAASALKRRRVMVKASLQQCDKSAALQPPTPYQLGGRAVILAGTDRLGSVKNGVAA